MLSVTDNTFHLLTLEHAAPPLIPPCCAGFTLMNKCGCPPPWGQNQYQYQNQNQYQYKKMGMEQATQVILGHCRMVPQASSVRRWRRGCGCTATLPSTYSHQNHSTLTVPSVAVLPSLQNETHSAPHPTSIYPGTLACS